MMKNAFFAALSALTAADRLKRWALALSAAVALLVCSAPAHAVTYNYTLPNQTWGRPPAGSNCSGTKTTTTYATLTISLLGSVTVTATRSTGTGISLTLYQGPFFPNNQCVNFWDTTNVSTTNTVSRSLTYNPPAPYNQPSRFTFVVSGNGPADFSGITVTATPTAGSSYALVCNPGTFTPDEVDPPIGGGSHTVSYAPPFGAIGCDSWTATTTDSWIKNITPTSGVGTSNISFTTDANTTGEDRYGSLNVGSASLDVYQEGGPVCEYSIYPTSVSAGAAASSGSFSIDTDPGCAWTATTTSSFVTGVTGSGTGVGTINYNLAANTGPARTATITAGGQTYTINQAGGCTYTLSATSASPSAAGGSASLTVTPSNAACTWTASSNASFLTGVTASGTGTGTVNYTVGANTGVARSGTLTVAGQTFTVNQPSGCTFSVSPSSVSPTAAAGTGSLTITASNAACPWTASNNDAWLAVSPSSGTGNATVTYNVAANTGPSRTGSLTVGGQTISFNQANGCTASLASAGATIDGSGGSGSVSLTLSSPACAWSASSSAPWVSVPSSGTGSSVVNFTVAASTGPARIATLTIAGQTFTIEQANACTYSINPTSAAVGAAAGTGSVQVTASDPACTFAVGSNAAWLASTLSNGQGTQSVSYDYAANSGPARGGTMTIAGKTFTVNQADGCTASLASSSTSASAAGSSGSFTLTLSAPTCAWSASTSSDFISGVTSSGTGTGSVAFTVAPNVGPARSGTITAGGKTFTINQASGCTASLGSTSASAAATGGASSVDLTLSAPSCPWTASSNASWLSVATSGTGSGQVSYTAAANAGLSRSGTLTIAGQTFTVEQADGCSFTLSTTQAFAPAPGGSGVIQVTASDPACSFSASAEDEWLTNVTPGGTGSTTINYTVAANTGMARTGTLSIAGQTVSIEQNSGCVATISTQSVSLGEGGGSVTLAVALSSAACTWTAAANQPFISNVQFTGTGSGSVTFDVAPNLGVSRTGTLTVAGKTVTVTQGDGCSFLINPTGAEQDASGTGPFTFELTASDASCPWTMQGHDPWVTINTPTGTGSSTLSYSTQVNVGPARSSTIDVGGRTFTVLQDNGCSASVSPSGIIELSAAAQASEFTLTLSDPTCGWTAASNNSWLTVADTSGTGNGQVHFSVEANTGPERTLQIQLQGDQTVTVRQASGCAVTLPAASASAQPAGGTATFNVDTVNGCAYTAEADVEWLTDVTVTEQGVSYSVAASDGVARVGKITVKSTTTGSLAEYIVTQASGCVLVLPSGGSAPEASGGPASFEVQTVAGCQFTVSTTDTWLEPISVVDGTVSYQAAPNVGPARTGKISVTSTDTGVTTVYAVSQESGCTVLLTMQSLAMTKSGGASSFNITTAEGCAINVASPNAWLSGFTHTGGVVSFVAAENLDSDRQGTIVVTATDTGDSVTFTVTEASGCTVTLPVASAEVGAAGGAFSFGVNTGLECGFEISSDAPWLQNLTVSEGEPGGSFSAQANTGVARTATITITDKETGATATYVVHQAGAITTPVISSQPKGVNILVGETLRLEVVASGGDLHYQWRKDGVDIPGATSMEYRIMSAAVGDSGSYDVVITNDAGSVTSSAAIVVVSVEPPPNGTGGTGGGGTGGSGGGGTSGTSGTDAAGEAGAPNETGGTSGGGTAGTSAGPNGDAGEAPSAGTHGDPAADAYVGGGSCNCSVIGGAQRQLAGSAAALLAALALFTRRRRASK